MTSALAILLAGAAHATGYGVIDADGYPSYLDRDVHMWTNVVRVEPDAFESLYNSGGCSFDDFQASEQEPHAPLYYDRNLNIAAVYHSTDMYETGNFSHTSSDGTSFGDRVARYYTESGYVGENIAYGYGTPYNAIFVGWMCSSGHRSNIMGDYNELGTADVSDYLTQDFGAGTVDVVSPVAMGIHAPVEPTGEVEFYVDWQDAAPPSELRVVLNGEPLDLAVAWGTERQGVFTGSAEVSGLEGCGQYYFRWATASGAAGTFPETGSYTFGDCAATDEQGAGDLIDGWTGSQMCVLGIDCRTEGEMGAGIELIGCATSGRRSLGWVGVIAPFAIIARRRRRSER